MEASLPITSKWLALEVTDLWENKECPHPRNLLWPHHFTGHFLFIARNCTESQHLCDFKLKEKASTNCHLMFDWAFFGFSSEEFLPSQTKTSLPLSLMLNGLLSSKQQTFPSTMSRQIMKSLSICLLLSLVSIANSDESTCEQMSLLSKYTLQTATAQDGEDKGTNTSAIRSAIRHAITRA